MSIFEYICCLISLRMEFLNQKVYYAILSMLLQCIDLCLFIQKIFIEHLLYVSIVLDAIAKRLVRLCEQRDLTCPLWILTV